jgi:hypothetical protein
MSHPITEMRVDVVLYQSEAHGSGLRFTETVNVETESFEGLAAILKRFHDLFQEIKARREGLWSREPTGGDEA